MTIEKMSLRARRHGRHGARIDAAVAALLHHRFRGARQDGRRRPCARSGTSCSPRWRATRTRAISSATADWDAHRLRVAARRAAQGVHRLPGVLADGRILRLRALQGDEEARQEPRDRAAVRLHEPRRGPPCRLHQRRAEGIRHRRQSRLPDQGQEVHLLPAEVHLLRHLSVGEDRLRPLHHHLPASRAQPGPALPPDLQVVREVVQRRVPPRRGVRAADAGQSRLSARA